MMWSGIGGRAARLKFCDDVVGETASMLYFFVGCWLTSRVGYDLSLSCHGLGMFLVYLLR